MKTCNLPRHCVCPRHAALATNTLPPKSWRVLGLLLLVAVLLSVPCHAQTVIGALQLYGDYNQGVVIDHTYAPGSSNDKGPVFSYQVELRPGNNFRFLVRQGVTAYTQGVGDKEASLMGDITVEFSLAPTTSTTTVYNQALTTGVAESGEGRVNIETPVNARTLTSYSSPRDERLSQQSHGDRFALALTRSLVTFTPETATATHLTISILTRARSHMGSWAGNTSYAAQSSTSNQFDQYFRVSSPTTVTVSGTFSNPVLGSTQLVPILPSSIVPPTAGSSNRPAWDFHAGSSHKWIDPETAFAYDFVMSGASKFNRIADFPAGFKGKFTVTVGSQVLGTFGPGEPVDFVARLGAGVKGFRVSDIMPLVDAGNPATFPIQLDFDTPTADFTMRPLTVPTLSLSRPDFNRLTLIFDGKLQTSSDLIQWTDTTAASPLTLSISPAEKQNFWRSVKVAPVAPGQ